DKGFLTQAALKVETESAGPEAATQMVEVNLTRVAGNTLNIAAAPPSEPAPGGGPAPAPMAVTKGQVRFNRTEALTEQDKSDYPERAGRYYKAYPVVLVGGKTYIFEMNKVGEGNLGPYLVLLNAAGQKVAEDNDGGGGVNARMIY